MSYSQLMPQKVVYANTFPNIFKDFVTEIEE